MPYTTKTKMRNGKKVYCMTSSDTGKTYCYKSMAAMKKGKKIHEMFKKMPKKKIRIAKKKK